MLSGDTPLLTTELLAGARRGARGDERAAATVLSFEPADARSYGRVVRGRRRHRRGDRRGGRRDGGAARAPRVQLLDLRLPHRGCSGRRSTGSSRTTPRASSTSPTRCATSSSRGERVVAHVAADAGRDRGREHPRRARRRGRARCATGSTSPTCSRASTIVDPASTWIEPRRRARAGRRRRSRSRSSAARRGSPPARRSARMPWSIDAEIGAEALVGPFCYVRPGTVLGPRSKAGTFVELKKAIIGEGTKVPHLSYIGDAEIGQDTNIGAGSITANFPHRPGQPKGKTTIGDNVRVAVDTMFVAPVTVGDDAWTAAGSVVTDDVPDNALAGFPAKAGQQGGSRWKAGRLSRRCPASRAASSTPVAAAGCRARRPDDAAEAPRRRARAARTRCSRRRSPATSASS